MINEPSPSRLAALNVATWCREKASELHGYVPSTTYVDHDLARAYERITDLVESTVAATKSVSGEQFERQCAKAAEKGMADAHLDRHDDKLWIRAARVIRAVHNYLPGQNPIGLREGMTLGRAVIKALECNPPRLPVAVVTTGSDHATAHHAALANVATLGHLHDIDAGGSCRDPQCGYNSDVAYDKAVSNYVRGDGPSPYGDVAPPCANPHHAHTLNDALRAKDPDGDEDPVTWAHCADCHSDAYDHGTDLTGPHCGHFAGCPNC